VKIASLVEMVIADARVMLLDSNPASSKKETKFSNFS